MAFDPLASGVFGAGDRITTHSLSAAQYNGLNGIVRSSTLSEDGRHKVELSVVGQPGHMKMANLKPSNLVLVERAYVEGTPAILRESGAVSFTPQSHCFCGHCNAPFMGCACDNIPHGNDFNFMYLPEPLPNSTPRMLIRRWVSVVDVHITMRSFHPELWFWDNIDSVLGAIGAAGSTLQAIMEDYAFDLPADPNINNIMKVAGFPHEPSEPSNLSDEGVFALCSEARAAAAIFLSGDWCTLTKLQVILLNNAFQNSDPVRYPTQDPSLRRVFDSISILSHLMNQSYSNLGWRLALEYDRPPCCGVTPPLKSAGARDPVRLAYERAHPPGSEGNPFI